MNNIGFGVEAVKRMQERASCRVFRDDPIPDNILKEIINTGLRAASGGNLQPYSIIVVKDKAKNKQLAELCHNQNFMGSAPVNLIFLLDHYKLSRIAAIQKAPFTSHLSYMPFLIGLEDVVCCAQSIETAAWQLGVGSVYIGTVNNVGRELVKIYKLPKYTYPVLILTLGYPKNELPLRARLPYEMTVFEEEYPHLTDEQISRGFAEKYGENLRLLPNAESAKNEWLDRLKLALLSTYSKEETQEIIDEVIEAGGLKHFQYVFGLHYHAQEMLDSGKKIMEMLKEQGLEPFYMYEKGNEKD